MPMKWMAMLGVLAVLAGCAPGPSGETPPTPQRLAGTLPAEASAAAVGETDLSRRLLALVNDARRARGAAPLAADARLQQVAAVHSADMAQRGFFGHHNPNGQGTLDRVLIVDPGFQGRIGENLYTLTPGSGGARAEPADVKLAGDILAGWMASPRHRKQLVDAAYNRTGIGIARSGRSVFVTQVFAGP